MNLDFLLLHRDELRRAARLANLAYAYQWLGNFAWKVAWLGLRGEVVLQGANAQMNRPQAMIVAQDFSQSVAEEHFLPEEIEELHAVITSVHDSGQILEMKFRLEEIGDIYRPVLRRVLEMADVLPKREASAVDEFRPRSDAA
jgi:hypothetical protein